jgi:predicted component of type VI protein secretion system
MPKVRSCLVLRVLGGKRDGTEISVRQGSTLRIGRSDDSQLRLQHEHVSRRHCEVFYSLAGFMVKDCGSRCGTFLDEQRVNDPTLLTDGQRLRIGPFSFLAIVPERIETPANSSDSGVGDAEICRWLDEAATREPPPAPRTDESAIYRKELKLDELSCEAAEHALEVLQKRKSH